MRLIKIIFAITLIFLLSTEKALAESTENLSINSESAILVDSRSGAILYEKNSDKRLYPASLTKIATAIYAIENGDLDDLVTVSANAAEVDGTKVFLVEGEKTTLKHLIQGMLINSGNDAAIAIAEHLDGNVEQFSKKINQYLRKTIDVKNTNFTNPNGLFHEEHYTTSYDLAKITNYALKNPVFKDIFGTKELIWDGESWDTTLITHHRLLKGEIPFEDEITGGKTGYVDQSKQTLATTANNKRIELTAIVLKNDSKTEIYKETTELLRYGFTNFQTKELIEASTFKANDKKYFLPKNTFITESIEGSRQSINNKGHLIIEDSHGKTIHSIPLQVKKRKAMDSSIAPPSEEKIPFRFFLAGITLITLTGLFLTKKKFNYLQEKISKKL